MTTYNAPDHNAGESTFAITARVIRLLIWSTVFAMTNVVSAVEKPEPDKVWSLCINPVEPEIDQAGWAMSMWISAANLAVTGTTRTIDGVRWHGNYLSKADVDPEAGDFKAMYLVARRQTSLRVLDVWIDAREKCVLKVEEVPAIQITDLDTQKKLNIPVVLEPGKWRLQVEGPMLGNDGKPRTDTFPPLLFAAEVARKILQYNENGQIAWEYPAEMSRDVWLLPGGNILFCYNNNYDSRKDDNPSGVMEVTPSKQVVFHFKTTGQVWSCQRLADGSTLVGASSQGKLLIVSPKAEIVREIKLINRGGHSCIRNARQIKGGDFLVAEESARAVRRYSPEGNLVREIKVNFAPYSAVLLESGNILACGQQTMVELDERDKSVWSLEGKDVPDMGVRWFAGIQVLPNGNIFICNAGGKIGFFEITREKKIAWQSKEGFPMGHGIQRLDVKGEAMK